MCLCLVIWTAETSRDVMKDFVSELKNVCFDLMTNAIFSLAISKIRVGQSEL